MILWLTHRIHWQEPRPELSPPLKTWPRMGLVSVSLGQAVWRTTTLIPSLGSSFTCPSVKLAFLLNIMVDKDAFKDISIFISTSNCRISSWKMKDQFRNKNSKAMTEIGNVQEAMKYGMLFQSSLRTKLHFPLLLSFLWTDDFL